MKLLAIDGNSLINRAFYGIKLLTTKSGQFTNGIFGFINMLNRLMELEKPDGVAVAFDLRSPTFRHKMYDGYKAGRKGMPDELASQMPLLKEWLKLMGYAVLEHEGFEADDILGSLAAISEKTGDECVIATGDRDALQLVSDKVRVLNTVTKMGHPEIIEYTPAAVKEKYGVEPIRLIDIKALQGDASDNIPGVAGVGEKTAAMLVSQFGTIDEIYQSIETLDIKENLRLKLISGRESAYLSRDLGTICRTAPIDENLESYRFGTCDRVGVAALMARLELFSLIEKMGLSGVDVSQNACPDGEKTEYYVIDADEFFKKEHSVVDIFWQACDDGIECILVDRSHASRVEFSDGRLKKLLSENSIKKNIYDCKQFYKLCEKAELDLQSLSFDGVLAAYLCNPSANDYSLPRLVAEYAVPESEISGEKTETVALGVQYAELCKILTKKTEEAGLLTLLRDIELPLARVLGSMELCGFSVDPEGIGEMGQRLEKELERLEGEIYALAEEEFNINSPKQLGVILFEKLGLPAKKKTKSGYSTNAEVLESLREEHPVVENILEYRKKAKLKSTYCDGLVAAVEADGRIRSTLNQTETRTGRISSTEPNLQNIPVKTELGRELRKYFTAKEGCVLIDADYSQIELRVLADMANDDIMIDAYHRGTDIHTVTAAQVFGMPESMVTPLMRSRAKAVNFGIVYGIGAFSLARDIGVTRKEAAAYIDGYLATYSAVGSYMNSLIENAKRDGFVSTLFGRRRYLPELKSGNAILRAAGERIARNMPIQGTAADIIKIAMIRVYERLKAELPKARLIMQIHDELIVEAPENAAQRAKEILVEEMQSAVKLKVPLIVDAGIGATWYEAKA